MTSVIKYSNSPTDNLLRLQVKNGLDESSKLEILKGEYDLLWLYSGNFELMQTLVLHGLKISKIHLQSTEPQDISWISDLAELETLRVNGKVKGKINFSKLKKLKVCELDWCSSTKGIISSDLLLVSLGLSKFSGSLNDFCENTSENLSTLGLTGAMSSLEGIDKFTSLKELSLWSMKNLNDITPIEACMGLEQFQIETCNNVTDYSVLSLLTNLKQIFFENKLLPSLKCFPKDNLEYIRLGMSTSIEDKDVSLALSFPKLGLMSFPSKKGYSHNAEEINELLSKK
jgi:hypothetical protein